MPQLRRNLILINQKVRTSRDMLRRAERQFLSFFIDDQSRTKSHLSPDLGLLSHMEHMRMDPKHQFAAQYVLSRAAAERRERESLLAAAALATTTGALPLGLSGNQTSLCPSPSVHSESSSNAGDGRLSSNGSETPAAMLLQNSNNNNNNNSTNNNNSNNNNNSTNNTSNNNASSNNNNSSNTNNNLNNNNINNNNNNENVTAMKLAELMVGKAGKLVAADPLSGCGLIISKHYLLFK